MNNYIVIDEKAYKVAEADEFFRSINAWLEDDETPTSLGLLETIEGHLVMVDKSYEKQEDIVLGENERVFKFESVQIVQKVVDSCVIKPGFVTVDHPNLWH